MTLLNLVAKEYEKRKIDLDAEIEKKKTEFEVLSSQIKTQEDKIKLQEKEIKGKDEEIKRLTAFAEKNLSEYTDDLKKLKVKSEDDTTLPSIMIVSSSRIKRDRRRSHGT